MKTAVAITHLAFEDLGSLAGVLRARGFALEYIDAPTVELAALDPLAPDLLLVLGGPVGVYEQDIYPFLREEIRILKLRLSAGRPTIGLCLGAQLMAAALGASVHPGSNGKEIGWFPLLPPAGNEAALSEDWLQPLFAKDLRLLHWHGDTFQLPEGARLLASSEQYPHQAFAVGTHALAFQCHPEAEARALERWYVGHACELTLAGINVPALRAQSRCEAPKLENQAAKMWHSWLAQAFPARA